MWVAKIKYSTKGTLIGELCVKHNVDIFAFPISTSFYKKYIKLHLSGKIMGNKKDILSFLDELKKQKRTLNIESSEDFFVLTIKESLIFGGFYSGNVFTLEPGLISQEGYEILTIGSFYKKELMKAYDDARKYLEGKLLSIQNKKIKSISVKSVAPKLTDKQKQAVSLAIKSGYYNYPRKIDVKKLARISGLSFATFQAHLRKAENKLIPFSFE